MTARFTILNGGAVDMEFTAPTVPLSINRANGMHYGARGRLLKPWKDVAWALGRNYRSQAARTPVGRPLVPITVQVVLPFRTNTRRDPHNYTGTVVKAVVDGLKDAGIVPDDTAEWVTVLDPECVVVRQPDPLTATIRVRPRETP